MWAGITEAAAAATRKKRSQTKRLIKTMGTDVHSWMVGHRSIHFSHLNLQEAKLPLVSNYDGNFPSPYRKLSMIK